MVINDISGSDQEALRIVREKIAAARAEVEQCEATLREYETALKASLKPTVKMLLKQRKIPRLRRSLVKLKNALALAECAERELLDQISSSRPEVAAREQT
jgi:vacuolar-type H+-ATPase subunit I/STV1